MSEKTTYPVNETIRGLRIVPNGKEGLFDVEWTPNNCYSPYERWFTILGIPMHYAQRAMGILLETADWENTHPSIIFNETLLKNFEPKTEIRIYHAIHLLEIECELNDENIFTGKAETLAESKTIFQQMIKKDPRG